MKKMLVGLMAAVMVAGILVGCGGSATKTDDGNKKSLKIGTSSVSIDLAESGVKSLEELGYEVEIVVFDDYFLPNTALVEGSIDANFYQHEPFLNQFNEENKTDIVMLSPKLYEFYGGLYSVKAKSVEELPDGGKVGIATDASNIDRDLKNLQSVGVIKLTDKPQSGDLYSILDIVENPHNYEFIQADHTKYLNMDEYAAILGTSNTMATAGVDPTQNLLSRFSETKNAQGICVTAANKDTQWAKDIMTAYMTEDSLKEVPASTGFEPVANNK